LAEVRIEFFRRPHELQTKNKYIYKLSTIFFIVFISYQIVNKTRNLLFAIQLLIYIIYDDRTIIGLSVSLLTY
jgi:hypothetical protein